MTYDSIKKYLALFLFGILTACGGIENEKIDTKNEISSNMLIIPPCLK